MFFQFDFAKKGAGRMLVKLKPGINNVCNSNKKVSIEKQKKKFEGN